MSNELIEKIKRRIMPHRRTFDTSDKGSSYSREKKEKYLFRADGTRIGRINPYSGDGQYDANLDGFEVRDKFDANLYKSFVLGDEATGTNEQTGMATYTDPKTGKKYVVHGSEGVIDKKTGDFHSYQDNTWSKNQNAPWIGTHGNFGYMNEGSGFADDSIAFVDRTDVPHWSIKKGKNMSSAIYEGDHGEVADSLNEGSTIREREASHIGESYDYLKNLHDLGKSGYIEKFLEKVRVGHGFDRDGRAFQYKTEAEAIAEAEKDWERIENRFKVDKDNKHLDYNKDGKISREEQLSDVSEGNRTQRQVNRKLFDSDRSVYSRVNPETGETEWFTRWSIGKLGGKERKVSEKRAKFIKKKMHKRQDRVYGGE